jgi:hypothetical protein
MKINLTKNVIDQLKVIAFSELNALLKLFNSLFRLAKIVIFTLIYAFILRGPLFEKN